MSQLANPTGERSSMVHYARVDLSIEVGPDGYARRGSTGSTTIRVHPGARRGPELDALVASQLEALAAALRSGEGLITV